MRPPERVLHTRTRGDGAVWSPLARMPGAGVDGPGAGKRGDRLTGRRRRARGLTTAAVLLGALAGSGCGGADDSAAKHEASSPSTPVASGTHTLSATAPADAARAAAAAALAAYRGFGTAVAAAEAIPDPRYPDLAKYAGDKALAQERANLWQLAEAGIVVTGQSISSPVVADVSLGASPVVTITDCADTSRVTPIYKATGKSASAPGQPTRVKVTALARPYAGGAYGWVITDVATDRSRPC